MQITLKRDIEQLVVRLAKQQDRSPTYIVNKHLGSLASKAQGKKSR